MNYRDTQAELDFYRHFDALIQAATDREGIKIQNIHRELRAICEMLRLTRGVAIFYQTLNHERMGKGEVLQTVARDVQDEEVQKIRIATPSGAIILCTAFRAVGEPPMKPEETHRVDLVMRTILNIISRVRLQGVIEVFGFHDENGFNNIRFFMRYLERTNESGELGGKVAFNYNLRHFSLVNQEIGRMAGDRVMKNHFQRLQRIIGQSGVLARLGGDNFVAVCEKEHLDAALEYLKETPVVYDEETGRRIMITASVGVFPIPVGFRMRNPGEIMDKIMPAAIAARNGGKEHIVFFNDRLLAGKEKTMRVQQRFPEALRNEEFHVFYQPKVDVTSGKIYGAEALCRWFHKEQIIPPGEFIPVLEETNDICKLDFYMLEHVCMDIRRWIDAGLDVVRVSVNLSRKHMMDIDLLQNIVGIIDKYQVPHEYLEIELTETTSDVEFRDLKRVVGGLQQAGISTSVDDFGVGYSSLNLIREISWNVLKVDRSLLPTDGEDADSNRSIMFRHVVAMAKELGLECVAEGVETQAQVDVLRENQCEVAQGFFFDKPLPVEHFEERLQGFVYSPKE